MGAIDSDYPEPRSLSKKPKTRQVLVFHRTTSGYLGKRNMATLEKEIETTTLHCC